MVERPDTYDGMEELAEYDAITGARVARYDHDPSRIDALLGQATSAGKVNAVTDALGSIYALADTAASEVTRYSYDVYGARTASAEAVPTKWGFTGRVHERDTAGEMYYRARYLIAETGVFVSKDPLSHIFGAATDPFGFGRRNANLYWYAGGDPINRVDPWGLYDWNEAQTQCLIARGVAEYREGGAGNALVDIEQLLRAAENHSYMGKYDFKIIAPLDTFVVHGNTLRADEFGNYIAGYLTYSRFGAFGEFATRVAGNLYELPNWRFDDGSSVEMISLGIYHYQRSPWIYRTPTPTDFESCVCQRESHE